MCSRYTYTKNEAKLRLRDKIQVTAHEIKTMNTFGLAAFQPAYRIK